MKSAMVDWSSLPSDLIRRVADFLLATNDIDYYMDMRAVCCSWRAAMADPCRPGADAHLLVFHPRQWIMLDEHSEDEHRLFVNVSTGRFLRRRIPLLRDHVLVSVSDGLVILGESHVYAADMVGSVFKIVGTAHHCYGELIAKIPGELIAKIPSKPSVFLVESTGDLLLIRRSNWGFFGIFRVDVERTRLESGCRRTRHPLVRWVRAAPKPKTDRRMGRNILADLTENAYLSGGYWSVSISRTQQNRSPPPGPGRSAAARLLRPTPPPSLASHERIQKRQLGLGASPSPIRGEMLETVEVPAEAAVRRRRFRRRKRTQLLRKKSSIR